MSFHRHSSPSIKIICVQTQTGGVSASCGARLACHIVVFLSNWDGAPPGLGALRKQHTLHIMGLFHCMVRHGTVQYGSLLGGFPLGTVPGTGTF